VTRGPRGGLPAVALRVGSALDEHGIRGVLTGGACASLYTGGAYHSVDVDIILSGAVSRPELDAAMASVGFERRRDRYIHPDLPFFVEFPRGPLAIGADHQIRPVRYRRGRSRMLVLSATDACRDRLAAFYHWKDRQSLGVAVLIAARNRVRMSAIQDWSAGEAALDRFEEFRLELKRLRARRARPARRRVAPRRSTS
jgi:hypothetical protein